MPFVATAGSNRFGQLGRGSDTTVFEVVDIEDDVVQVCCGAHYSIAVTSGGAVYGWGRNDSGQLALPTPSVNRPARITDYATNGFRIVKAVCGEAHTLFLTDSGNIYSCGDGSCGQRGDGTYHGECFQLCRVLLNVTAKDVFCGARTSYTITTDGELFGWGETTSGMLGTSSLLTPTLSKPTRLFIGPPRIRVARVVASVNFAVLVTTTGEILGAGNNSNGQLGISDHCAYSWRPIRDVGRVSDVACGRQLTVCHQKDKNRCIVLSDILKSFSLPDIAGVASSASEANILAWTVNGSLLVHGRNSAGELGVGLSQFVENFTEVTLPAKAKVVSASCGRYHTCLLLSGEVIRDMNYVVSMEDSLCEDASEGTPQRADKKRLHLTYLCLTTYAIAFLGGFLMARQRLCHMPNG